MRIGFNTLSTYNANVLGGITDKAICTHGDNKDLFQKDLNGAIICLPQTIGSTTGGYVLMGEAGGGAQGDAVRQPC